MKKIYFVLFLLMAYNSQSQSLFGFKGGVNICRFTGPGVINGASDLVAANIGVYDNTPVAKNTSIQVELSLSWEGERFDQSEESGSFKFSYLNLPVLIQQKIAGGLFAETGPQIGLLLTATLNKTVSSPFEPSISTSGGYSDNLRTYNFSWDIGLGYKFSKMFAVDARYNIGLTNLGADQLVYKNSVLSFNVLFSPFVKHASVKHARE